MADIKISELKRVQSLNNGDLVEVSQEDSYSATGYSSKSAKMTDLGEKVVNGIEYTSELNTSNKKIIGAINEIASYTPVYGNTASGAIATFDTSLALPLQDCTIDINAVQEGSGTPSPSNPRAISGFDSGVITRCGKNWFNDTVGTCTVNANIDQTITIGDVWLKANQTYVISCKQTPNVVSSFVRNTFVVYGNGQTVFNSAGSANTIKPMVFTPTASGIYRIKVWGHTLSVDTDYTEFQVELENTPSEYHSYVGNTYTVDFGQTVYGGSLDVTSGVLTVDRAYVDLGTLTWTKVTSFTNILFLATVTGKATSNSNVICSDYNNVGIATDGTFLNNMANNSIASDTSTGIYIRDDAKSSLSVADFKTAMSGVDFVYELATPTTVQLTPTEISAIVSGGAKTTNNVFTDTNGNTSVVYACSLKDYIDSQ